MNEKEIANKTADKLMRGWADCPYPAPCRHCIASELESAYARGRAELQAAEERGRLRGVEERDELRALLAKLVAWADLPATKAVTMSAWIHGVKYRAEDVAVWDEARAALAPRDSAPQRCPHGEPASECVPCDEPRDSGPVCDAVVSSDPFREWRCGKPKNHEGPHSGDRK